MKKYDGKKNFKDFFAFLNEQEGFDKYKELSPQIIQEFKDNLSPLKLPLAYIEFMRYVGNGQYTIWIGSDYDFSWVPNLKTGAEELLNENNFQYKLKDDDFVFWMHQGYKFYFFNLQDGDDPPVYYYSECDDMTDFVKCGDTFTDFIIGPYITGIPNP